MISEPFLQELRENWRNVLRERLLELIDDQTVDRQVRAALALHLDRTVTQYCDQIELAMMRRLAVADEATAAASAPRLHAINGGAKH
jgi:hypothetical protein